MPVTSARIGFGVPGVAQMSEPSGLYSFRLTPPVHGRYLDPILGLTAMKRTRWMLGFLLMATVVWASSVLPLDDPETAFNEADAAITLAPPASIGLNSLPSAPDSIVAPNLSLDLLAWVVNYSADSPARVPSWRPSDSIQKLLCTFLI